MKRPPTHFKPDIPLTEPAFFILLSLAAGSKHGYAILRDVERTSGGSLLLSTSTLYGALGRLLEQGLIERVSAGAEANSGPGLPRKHYELSSTGRRALTAEMNRMRALALLARRRLEDEG